MATSATWDFGSHPQQKSKAIQSSPTGDSGKKKKIKTQSQKTNNKPTTVSLGYKVGMLYTPLKQGSIICFWVPTKRTPLNEWVSGICLYKNGKDNVAVTMKGTTLPKMNINVWFLVKSPFLESDT